MLIFDLRWLLFGVLTLLSMVTLISIYATRWYVGRRQSATFLRLLQPLLEDAPLGILMLADAQRYAYANPYVRRLFKLASEQGKLPPATWTRDLQLDLQQLRLAPQGRYRTVRLTPA